MKPEEISKVFVIEFCDSKVFAEALEFHIREGWEPIWETFRTPSISREENMITNYIILVVT